MTAARGATTDTRDHNGGVSLRDHFDRCLTDAEKLQEEKWSGHDENHELIALALKTQAVASEERLKAMNEWRGTVSDLTGRFVDRVTFEALKTTRAGEIEDMKLAAKGFLTTERYEREQETLLREIRAETWKIVTVAVAVTVMLTGLLGLLLRAMGL